MTGTLYGVGVGPGDPDLLTLKAARLIDTCPVVAYPAPDSGESFARSIVADRLSRQREIAIVVPMRAERFPAQEVYDGAAEEIAQCLDAGEDVCVLCEGDPFFYGSFMYLFARMSGRYETEIVPGISSLTTMAALSKRPLAARNDVLTIVPAPSDDETIRGALRSAPAVAFIKVGRHWPRLRKLLDEEGATDAAMFGRRLTLADEIVVPAKEAPADAPYFSMVVVYRGTEQWA